LIDWLIQIYSERKDWKCEELLENGKRGSMKWKEKQPNVEIETRRRERELAD